ncbi:hypothetical protein MX629_11420 [Carnobacterium divergens]|uniref:Uncharacterized protein n=1 Tax=Carnobacterium divergens TaxID=2748 RepID=A0AAW8RG35_CARDV|nr:hypothetical protein [Carnobacterium divergens]MDT1959039.1 hypothetical protein [Carnobacterium divergens]MDT1975148.1 hypothetical protein [Carnobacterium divergens]
MEGYTFDRMKVQAANDGALYNLLNKNKSYAVSDLLNGVEVSASGLNVYVDTGYALIQGRFIEVTEKVSIPLPANSSGYIVFEIDLTQINEFEGTPGKADYKGINNQLSLKYVENLTPGDINNNDKITTFPLASFTTNGSTTTLVKTKENYETIGSEKDTGWIKTSFVGDVNLYFRRIGNQVFLNGQGNRSLPKNSEALLWAIPLGVRPDLPIVQGEAFYHLGNTDSNPTNVTIIRIRNDASMRMIYRNNDAGCTFSQITWPTTDPFPS